MKVKKIAIVRLSALGDVVLLVPTVRVLQRCWPDAEITWITSNPAGMILQNLSGVEIKLIDKPKSPADYWRLWRNFGSYRFDVLLCMQASLRTNLIYPLISATRKIGFDKKRGRDGHRWFVREQIEYREEHLLDGFMGFAQHLGVNDCRLEWNLALESGHHDFASENLGEDCWVAINPSASKAERNWCTGQFVELIAKIKSRWRVNVVLTGGPNMREVNVASVIAQRVDVLNLVGKTSPKQLAAVLQRVLVLIAPDTGPVHLAVAQQTPVVGLYAVARPELSGPYGQLNHTVNRYPQAVRKFLHQECSAADWHIRVHHRDAMALITVDAVIEKLAGILDCQLVEAINVV